MASFLIQGGGDLLIGLRLGETTYVFECVTVQNPVWALLARFDQPAAAAAEERTAAWLDFVVRYRTEQGYGRARTVRVPGPRRPGMTHSRP